MFGSIPAAVALAPLMGIAAWLCLRRYNPATLLTAWRKDRPARSLISSLFLGGLALYLLVGSAVQAFTVRHWYDHLWTIYFVFWAVWLLGLRAAFVEQLVKGEV